MNEALLNLIVEQVDAHERKIDELHGQIKQNLSNTNAMELLQTSLDEIKVSMQQVFFPAKDLQQLSKLLETNLQLSKQPLQQKVVHHHYATKIMWATAALFLIVCLLLTGWYNTAKKVDLYKSNDTKYRYLKLQSNITLRRWCGTTDSLFIANANMRTIVLAQEEQKQRNMESLQRAMEMEEEAKRLKEQVKGNENTVSK